MTNTNPTSDHRGGASENANPASAGPRGAFSGDSPGAKALLDTPAADIEPPRGDRGDGSGHVVLDWNEQLVETVREASVGVPTTTRLTAMMNLSIHDAVNGINLARSLESAYEQYHVDSSAAPAGASRPAAAAAAAHRVLSELYPNQLDVFSTQLVDHLSELEPGLSVKLGLVWGTNVANEILELRAKDGANEDDDYEACESPDDPEPGCFRRSASWGSSHYAFLDTWVMTSQDEFRPEAPPALDSEQYAADVEEVYEKGHADELTEEEKAIAAFWRGTGGTARPPGRWILIALEAAKDHDNSLLDNARIFSLLGLAMGDAGIVTWESKRYYGLWRPRTAIYEADSDGNTATQADPDWTSFALGGSPEYASGLALFGGAGATVLEHFFGEDYSFDLTVRSGFSSDELEDVTRSYDSFDDALEESRESRLFVGNHFPTTLAVSRDVGRNLGEYVLENALEPVN